MWKTWPHGGYDVDDDEDTNIYAKPLLLTFAPKLFSPNARIKTILNAQRGM